MDLSLIDLTAEANEGAWLNLYNPKNPTEVFDARIHVLGMDSQAAREVEDAYGNKRLEELTKRGKLGKLTVQEQRSRGVRVLARITRGWENIEWEGNPLEFNQKNAEKLYRERQWIADQVNEFAGDPANFGKDGERASVFDADTQVAKTMGE